MTTGEAVVRAAIDVGLVTFGAISLFFGVISLTVLVYFKDISEKVKGGDLAVFKFLGASFLVSVLTGFLSLVCYYVR